MMSFDKPIKQLRQLGYAVAPALYKPEALNSIENLITTYLEDHTSHKSDLPLFAIRKLLKKIPQLKSLLFNENLLQLLDELIGADAFLTKSIYFDKPERSNWFVSFHQDISISVKDKTPKEGYINWTRKKEILGVQPPLDVLESTYTIRLHLDYTDASNGGLMVIPGSHKKGIVRIDREKETFKDIISPITERGELLLMQPLTIHASKRATTMKRRRVIHMEFSNVALAPGLAWDELETLNRSRDNS